MRYDEVWSYSREQISEYLQECGPQSCHIYMESRPDHVVGPLTFPRTRVVIEGPGAEEFHHQFRLHFLSGGA